MAGLLGRVTRPDPRAGLLGPLPPPVSLDETDDPFWRDAAAGRSDGGFGAGLRQMLSMTPEAAGMAAGLLPDVSQGAMQGAATGLLGTPVDLAAMAMKPFGYDHPAPVGGSEWWKQRGQAAGVYPGGEGSTARQIGGLLGNIAAPGPGEMTGLLGALPFVPGLAGVIAHHASDADFARFSNKKLGSYTKDVAGEDTGFASRLAKFGHWLSDDGQKVANSAGYPNVMKFDIPDPGQSFKSLRDLEYFIEASGGPAKARKALLGRGIETVSVRDGEFDVNSFVLLDPKKGKRITENGSEPLAGYAAEPDPSHSPQYRDATAKGLDMSQEARMARAREQGFDTENPVYHGAQAIKHTDDGTEAVTEMRGGRGGLKMMDGMGVHFGTVDAATQRLQSNTGKKFAGKDLDPNLSNSYIMPLNVNMQKPFVKADGSPFTETELQSKLANIAVKLGFDKSKTRAYSSAYPMRGDVQQAVKQHLIDQGYDGIPYINSHEDRGSVSGIVFDPSQLRSTHAAFDPAKRKSADLLANRLNPGYDPLPLERRPFGADYPEALPGDAGAPLGRDIDGRPLTAPADRIAGRRTSGGDDLPLSSGVQADVAGELGVRDIRAVPAGQLPRKASGSLTRNADGEREVRYLQSLAPDKQAVTISHEIGHVIDEAAGKIDPKGLNNELRPVFHNLATRGKGGKGLLGPEMFGYKGDDVPRELMAEAIRAYMADPNYLKTAAPKTAARIRATVNTNPRLSKAIQFNSIGGLGLLGMSAYGDDR